MERDSRRLGRPPNDEMPEGERRAEIIRAATALFEVRGYAAVSLSDIAAAVGVTKATILHHFGSKAGLYEAVMADVLGQIGQAITAIATSADSLRAGLEALAHYAIMITDAAADLDAMLRDAATVLPPSGRAAVAAAEDAMHEAVTAVMRTGIARGELAAWDPQFLAHAFFHWLNGFGGRRGTETGFQGRPEVATAIVALFLDGAADPAAPRGP